MEFSNFLSFGDIVWKSHDTFIPQICSQAMNFVWLLKFVFLRFCFLPLGSESAFGATIAIHKKTTYFQSWIFSFKILHSIWMRHTEIWCITKSQHFFFDSHARHQWNTMHKCRQNVDKHIHLFSAINNPFDKHFLLFAFVCSVLHFVRFCIPFEANPQSWSVGKGFDSIENDTLCLFFIYFNGKWLLFHFAEYQTLWSESKQPFRSMCMWWIRSNAIFLYILSFDGKQHLSR